MTKLKTVFAPSLADEAGTIMIGGIYHIITRGHRHILPSLPRTVLLGQHKGLSWQINVRTISTERRMEACQVKGSLSLAQWLSACHPFLNNMTDTYFIKALTVWEELSDSREKSCP